MMDYAQRRKFALQIAFAAACAAGIMALICAQALEGDEEWELDSTTVEMAERVIKLTTLALRNATAGPPAPPSMPSKRQSACTNARRTWTMLERLLSVIFLNWMKELCEFSFSLFGNLLQIFEHMFSDLDVDTT
ncbi:hypothetical protein PILCRDRAFT_90685 [Piloderma croceum F 1598]|uniref:Uncharacterized protein n=1 Tax=Piloderma croceum (strain F 1598) TaxID=765440 RepID=A0A0C3AWA6_PILCF|nr:hypothetical protein PILCRDRAFT_90685 [Piloderma croceum F 1598]